MLLEAGPFPGCALEVPLYHLGNTKTAEVAEEPWVFCDQIELFITGIIGIMLVQHSGAESQEAKTL